MNSEPWKIFYIGKNVMLFRIFLIFGLIFTSSCAYYQTYNSLHWAKEAYKQGIKTQQDQRKQMMLSGRGQTRDPRSETSGKVVGEPFFEECAKKCLFFLSQNPKSRRTDDALLLMGKAFFELRRYIQAENSLRTLLETQRKSKLRDDAQYYLIQVLLNRDEVLLAELPCIQELPKRWLRRLFFTMSSKTRLTHWTKCPQSSGLK